MKEAQIAIASNYNLKKRLMVLSEETGEDAEREVDQILDELGKRKAEGEDLTGDIYDRHLDEWFREQQMEAAMLHGVQGYNDFEGC